MIVTDRIPVQEGSRENGEIDLSRILLAAKRDDSRSNLDLQIADYFTCAIYRQWSKGDSRAYSLKGPAVKSEIEADTRRVQ